MDCFSSKKPKIAIIGLKGLPSFGGAARSIEEILNKLNYYFNFTTYEIESHAEKEYFLPNVKRIIFKNYKSKRLNTFLYYLKSLYHVLFIEKYDLIHTNHLYCGFIIPFLKIKYKVINTAHGIIPSDDIKWNKIDKYILKFFESLAIKYSDKLITVSKCHTSYLKKHNNREVIFIPNGININTNISHCNNCNNGYILFAAARIIKLKGLHVLLEALNKINYRQKIIIIGDLEQSKAYKNQILKISADLNIEFKGLIRNRELLFKFIKKAKIFIFPSFHEGMSNMLLEVASLQTPIVCSDIMENKEIFTEEDVLFFKVGNIEDLAEKIIWVESNMELLKCKAQNAYNKLILEYNWLKIAEIYKNIYLSLL